MTDKADEADKVTLVNCPELNCTIVNYRGCAGASFWYTPSRAQALKMAQKIKDDGCVNNHNIVIDEKTTEVLPAPYDQDEASDSQHSP